MVWNRSVPTDTVLPHIAYPDVEEAIAWLTSSFGFTEHYRYGEPANGAQMYLGKACIMLRRRRPGEATPAELGAATQSVTVFVEDVDAHYERSKTAGAKIVEHLQETAYGERQYGVEDFAGHHWLFARHARDVKPDAWGARVATPIVLTPQIFPMLAVSDAKAAIGFYRAAFGATVLWQVGEGDHIVAGLSVHGAPLFLAREEREYGQRSPSTVGFTTVRIELFVDDPAAVYAQAVAAGARDHDPVVEYQHAMTGPHPIKKMLQGSVKDPFGHTWLIGKILE